MDDSTEPNAVEYARYHGLALDWSLHGLDDSDSELLDVASAECFDIADFDEASQLDLSDNVLNEKLSIDIEARKLLRAVFELQKRRHPKPDLDVRHVKWLRREEPLLLTDPRQDVKKFLADQTQQKELDITKLPTIEADVNEEADLSWPLDDHNLLTKCETHVDDEKLQISRDAFLLLQQIRTSQTKHNNVSELYEDSLRRQRRKARQPLTPPLTPPLSPILPPSSSSPVNKACLAPWEMTPSTSGAGHTVDKLMQDDNDMMMKKLRVHFEDDVTTSELEQLYSPLRKKAVEPSLSSSPSRPQLRALRVEPPLSPVYRPSAPHSEPFDRDNLPVWDPLPEPSSDENINRLFDEVIEPAALKVQQRVLNEKLHEADATKRVKVPDLTVWTSSMPWTRSYSKEEEDQEIQDVMVPIAANNLHYLPISRLDKELPWSVYPRAKPDISFEEAIQNRGLVDVFIKLDPGACVRYDTLTWKPEGLRILDKDDDEEELELPEEPEEVEPVNETRRQLSGTSRTNTQPDPFFAQFDDFFSSQGKQTESVGLKQPECDRTEAASPHQQHENKVNTNFLDFSMLVPKHQPPVPLARSTVDIAPTVMPTAADELDRFLGIQGQQNKRRKLNHAVQEQTPTPMTSPPSQPAAQEESGELHEAIQSEPDEITSNISLLPLPSHLPRRQIIASTKIIADLPLFRQLTKLYPDLDIVERDYSVAVQSAVSSPHALSTSSSSPTRTSPTASKAQSEADIILSPTTGLIITPLARLHQMPLPGSLPSHVKPVPGHSVRTMITTLATRYTRLIMLVTSSSASVYEVDQLDKRDAAALTSLGAFASNLRDTDGICRVELEVVFVANGIEPLARQLVNIIANEPPLAEALQAIELNGGETTWETWLRDAGLNAWVAQVLVAELIGHEGWISEAEVYARIDEGLTALKTCGQEERRAWLASVLVDEGLVAKVVKAIEGL